MAFSLKLPDFLSGRKRSAGSDVSAATVIDVVQPAVARKAESRDGALSNFSVTKKLQIFGGLLVVVMIIVAAMVYNDNRKSTYAGTYIATAGEMRMLSQRLSKSASLLLQGDKDAFGQLVGSYTRFSEKLKGLSVGGDISDEIIPP